MVLLETEPIAIASFIVSILAVFVAVPAAWGAVRAIKYAKEAPTRKDLERVEGNTLRTSEHLEGVKKEIAEVKGNTATTSQHVEQMKSNIARIDKLHHRQHDIAELKQRASRVNITGTGNQRGTVPFKLDLSLKDKELEIFQVELLNEHGNLFGSFHCVAVEHPLRRDFYTYITMKKMSEWFNAGTPVESMNRRRLKLRVWLLMDDVEIQRDMAVIITDTSDHPFTGPHGMGFMLEGSV